MNRNCFATIVAVCLTVVAWPVIAHENLPNEAYQLRMKGKLDQAKTLLAERIENSPNDAMAHFELARTEMHMALGEPRQLVQGFESAQHHIDQAVKSDPRNVAFHVFAGHLSYFRAYYAQKMNSPDLKKHFLAACRSFDAALQLKPDYPQVMLYLVELHSQFPESAGANREKAKLHAEKLDQIDDVFSAKAKSILAPNSCGVEFWKRLSKDNPNNTDVLEELAKAYLKDNRIDQAEKHIEKAIEIDPTKSYLFLDLSIYHTFRAMRARSNDKSLFNESVAAGDAAITKYLKANPIPPMKAFALGVQSKYKSATGEVERGRELVDRAERLDPYFSKATGAPLSELFIPPTSISTNHRYLMRPF